MGCDLCTAPPGDVGTLLSFPPHLHRDAPAGNSFCMASLHLAAAAASTGAGRWNELSWGPESREELGRDPAESSVCPRAKKMAEEGVSALGSAWGTKRWYCTSPGESRADTQAVQLGVLVSTPSAQAN